MRMNEASLKVTTSHLKRDAYLYVRQSTLRQVMENSESTQRQYALRERAVALGWPMERVHVIDRDLGQSGASAADREGFQQLVSEVGIGRAGIVLGLEVSRLARNCTDWHRLLEICALSDTLILDEDGLYSPNNFNDRLLLGLKGTMSEAELHLLRARLRGGILSKARRGELAGPLPVGFSYDAQRRVQLDPDKQVREAIALLFATYRRTGSAMGVVKHFRKEGLLFPRRLRKGPRKGELIWAELEHSRALQLLHNPRYAGAFFFGRTRTRKRIDGAEYQEKLDRADWQALIPDAHEGYITWEDYEDNQRRLRVASQAYGSDRRKSPPREGPALLQGIVWCGICGKRMTVRYHVRRGGLTPDYVCQRDGIAHGQRICQHIPGGEIDAAIGDLLLEMITPLTLDIALAVQQELACRLEEADRLRAQQVQRVRYEADLAQQRYMKVDPNNRLVADVLEAEWNEKLRTLEKAQEEYEQKRQADRLEVDDRVRSRVMALTSDFPRLWRDPNTSDRDRKRMVRLMLEDVTLIRKDRITVHVCFKGGTSTTLELPLPKPAWEERTTSPAVVQEIDALLNHHTVGQVVGILNERGLRSGTGGRFSRRIILGIRQRYGLKCRYDRLRESGMLTLEETAKQLGVKTCTVKAWRREGLLKGHLYNDKSEFLYDPPGPDAPQKSQGRRLSGRRRFPEVLSNQTEGVQYEA
jgi:DNA invertase Pin-like site-specific DNA recombinase